MSATLHIVAACSDRKRGTVLPEHQLRAYEHGPRRAAHWLRALRAGGERRPARELYVGNHWSVARALTTEAETRGWRRAPLWAASAGAGLVLGDVSLPAYGATFSKRHEDGVFDARSSIPADEQMRDWWGSLVAGSGSSLLELARKDRDAALLVVASRSYVDAFADDLVAALRVLRQPSRVVIVTSDLPRSTELHAHVVSAQANMCSSLGGAVTSLHARLARHLVTAIAPGDWAAENAREVARKLAATSVARIVPQRELVRDEDVRSFVKKELRADPSASATKLLRAFRTSGQACEQKRFKQLFQSVRN